MFKNPISATGLLILLLAVTAGAPLSGRAAGNGAAQVSAQAKVSTIKGRVVDGEGTPLVGAVIQVQGKAGGVIASSDGLFEIQAAPKDVLVATFLGMRILR